MEEINSGMNNNMGMRNSIDRLPDELLISIVSRLPVKYAARTSVLAHKWRYFWVFSSILDFDGSQVISKLKNSNATLYSEKIRWFENLVDRVLNLHSGTTIEEFRILFDLGSTSSTYINRWLEYAFKKRVRRLELDLVLSHSCYKFPNICDPIERLPIFPIGLSSCESLVTLRLSKVGITGEVLEFLISNCPSLEELCVEFSKYITSLRTSCPFTRLRRLEIRHCPLLRILEICLPSRLSHLEIRCCRQLSILEICSPNLLSFTLWGSNTSMSLKNVSSLINLSLGPDGPETIAYKLVQISGCLSRLETLMIRILNRQVLLHPLPNFPNLPRLKKLVLNIWGYGCESLLCFAPLVDAAPMLSEIVLKMNSNFVIGRDRGTIDSTKGQRLECLELARYVIEHAVSLKKVVIEFLQPLEVEEMLMAREGFRLLKAKLSEGVELIVR